MLDSERLRKNLPEFVNKANKIQTENESRANKFVTTNKVEEIRNHTEINLRHCGVYDDISGQHIFIGYSAPVVRGGYGLAEEVAEKINELKANFWIVANVNYPRGLKGRLTRLITSPLDLPIHMQVAVDNTGELKKLTLPRSLNKHQIEEMGKKLPLLYVLEKVTEEMEPVRTTEFPWDYFKQKETSSFLLPELL